MLTQPNLSSIHLAYRNQFGPDNASQLKVILYIVSAECSRLAAILETRGENVIEFQEHLLGEREAWQQLADHIGSLRELHPCQAEYLS